jgi:hypothetical protein
LREGCGRESSDARGDAEAAPRAAREAVREGGKRVCGIRIRQLLRHLYFSVGCGRKLQIWSACAPCGDDESGDDFRL